MTGSAPHGWIRPTEDSWLARLMARRARHPDEFDCAVRVVSGTVAGESARWSYRRSAVDPLVLADMVVTLNHGPGTRLRLRFTGEERPGDAALRRFHVVWPATEMTTGASVEVAADVGEGTRLYVR